MMATTTADRTIAAQFSSISGLPGTGLSWLQTFRSEGQAAFSNAGFPAPRAEEWRYTNVSALAKKIFNQPVKNHEPTIDPLWLATLHIPDAYTFVFIDGFYNPGFSDVSDLPGDILLMPMADALAQEPEVVQRYLGQAVDAGEHGFIAFNNARFSDGLFMHIPAGRSLPKPVQLLNIVTQAETAAVVRNVMVFSEKAEATVIETFAGLDQSYLTDSVTELFIGTEACATFCKLQCESAQAYHFGGAYIRQAEYSRFTHHNFAFGGLIARSDIHADLEQAAECTLNGLYVGSKRSHIDNHTRIHHRQPAAISRELYKGVLNDRARGVFQGRVIVAEQAQKTDSHMSNRNLLLSNDAEADTKPQLEIYADDVKCGHGVTVGQLDEKSIFYLQSRGVDVDAARNMLTFAFANEMAEKIILKPLHDRILAELLTFFPQENVDSEWL
jgi:Fe-S cluster assembly protein SufD